MIQINVQCTGKNSRIENTEIITDLSFQTINSTIITHSTGAVIGLPDPNNLPQAEKLCYNLLSGSITVSIADPEEADKYNLGQIYQLTVNNKIK